MAFTVNLVFYLNETLSALKQFKSLKYVIVILYFTALHVLLTLALI